MATRRWVGDALTETEIQTIQITAFDAATTYTITINGKDISVTGDTDADTTASNLSTAWNASTEPEVAEITASVSTDTITLTHDTAGVPFTVTTSVTGGTGTIGNPATTTAATGPNFWDNADNWEGATLPVDDDDVVFDVGDVDVKYALNQIDLTLNSIRINKSYTGNIGLPEINSDGSADYAEYRETYLIIASDDIEIGRGEGDGSGRIKIDTADVKTQLLIIGSGNPAETGIPAILWKSTTSLGGTTPSPGDTTSANTVDILKGEVGIAIFAGETATVNTLRVGYTDSPIGDVTLELGTGVTLTNLDMAGGIVKLNSGTTSIDMTNGELEIFSGAHAEINIDGGACFYRSTGTLTQGRVGSNGVLDCSRDLRARTFTNLELNENSSFRDPFKTITFSNAIQLPRTGVEKLTSLTLGDHYTIQRGAIP